MGQWAGNVWIHPRFGDLSSAHAVKMGEAACPQSFREADGVMIHLSVTGRCQARCKGCINSAVTLGVQGPRSALVACEETEPERDARIVAELASRAPEQPVTLCLYGGEPLLVLDKLRALRHFLGESGVGERLRLLLYTNGELLGQAMDQAPDLIREIWLYSVSIDGDREQHNRVRRGTDLDRIVRNLERLKGKRRGTVLHWSTLREEQSLGTCFAQFETLHREGAVDHFFWHWAEAKEPFADFPAFAERYGREFEGIMDVYVQSLRGGRLLPIAHVNELILYLAAGKVRGHSACGVELAANYDIVGGRIYPCADLPASMAIGELGPTGRLNLRECDLASFVAYKADLGCQACGVHAYCGGRCPVQAMAGSPERTRQYCQLMRLHVGIVQERLGDILDGLARCGLSLQDVYDRSAWLAPFTDVVP